MKEQQSKLASASKLSDFSREYGILYAMFAMWALVIILSLATPAFVFNWPAMLRTCSVVGFSAIGMAFCVISGKIDLSIGMMMSLLSVITITLLKMGFGLFTIPIVVVCGLLCGLLNGFFIAKVKIPAFIATLAMSYLFNAVARIISNETEIAFSEKWFTDIANAGIVLFNLKSVPQGILRLLAAPFATIPTAFVTFVVFAVFGTWILRRTPFGRKVVALGNSERAAKACGINTDLTTIGIYSLLGGFTAISAIYAASGTGMAGSDIMKGAEFTAITACVLGGTALAGGKGSIATTVIAAVFYQSITYCLTEFGVGTYSQMAIKGVILLAAITMSNLSLILSEYGRIRANLKSAALPKSAAAKS